LIRKQGALSGENMNKKTSALLSAIALVGIPAIAIADAGAAKTGYQQAAESHNWYNRINLSGFGAVGYARTDDLGADSEGSFEVQESKLFLEADISDDVSFFYEMDVVTEGSGDKGGVNNNQLYVNMNNVFGEDTVNLRVGRMDIPFGEEYTMEDANVNPLIDHSIVHPDGLSEGIMLHGSNDDFGWMLAVMNGNGALSQDSNSNKSINAKIYADLTDDVYVSASYAHSKEDPTAALFSGSSANAGARQDLDAAELDLKWAFDGKSNLWVAGGMVWVDTQPDSSDYFYVIAQPTYYVNDDFYLAARYSYAEGDDVTFTTSGNIYGAAGEVEDAQRIQLGFGYHIEENVVAKVEYSMDDYTYAGGSDDDSDFYGAQVVVTF